jgi:hypothetical protein
MVEDSAKKYRADSKKGIPNGNRDSTEPKEGCSGTYSLCLGLLASDVSLPLLNKLVLLRVEVMVSLPFGRSPLLRTILNSDSSKGNVLECS